MPLTRKANTPKKKRQWAHVEKSMLDRGASPGAAARAANGVIKKQSRKSKRKGRSSRK
jgi:hypothetical protein